MKKFSGLVVILATLVLGGYYGMGYVTERTLTKDVNIINQYYQPSGLYVDMQQYHRGWFTSTAQFKWNVHLPEHAVTDSNGQTTQVPAQDYSVDMPLNIHHGPIIFADSTVKFGMGFASTKIAMPKQFEDQFNTLFAVESTRPQVDLSVFVSYLNRSRFDSNVPPFKLIDKNGSGQLEWLGLDSSVTLSSNLKHISGNLKLQGINMLKGDTKATIGKIVGKYKIHKDSIGLYTGKMKFSFPSFLVSENNKTIFQLQSFDTEVSSDISTGLFSSFFQVSLEKIMAADKTYGPGSLKVALKNLDADSLLKISAEVNKSQQGTEQERQQALFALMPELPKLFSKGAEFDISELSFVVPEGTIQGNMHIALPKDNAANPFDMIKKVAGEGRLQLPAAVVKSMLQNSVRHQLMRKQALDHAIADKLHQAQTNAAQTTPAPKAATPPADIEQQIQIQSEQKLSALVQAGVFVTSDSDYVTELKFEHGQLSVNGKPFNPATMRI